MLILYNILYVKALFSHLIKLPKWYLHHEKKEAKRQELHDTSRKVCSKNGERDVQDEEEVGEEEYEEDEGEIEEEEEEERYKEDV